MNNMVEGNRDYVLKAIDDAFASDAEELPMEYFLDISYDDATGKVTVDLDLPMHHHILIDYQLFTS